MRYKAHGTIKYNGNWLILDAPNSLVKYYKFWVEKFTWKKISTPLFGAHCTVVAGKFQDVTKHPAWRKYHGKRIEFEYSNIIRTDERASYYWLPVYCDELKKIRMELGLEPFPKFPYHITIGFYELNHDKNCKCDWCKLKENESK